MSNLAGPFPSLSPFVPCGNSSPELLLRLSPAHAPLRTLARQAEPADAFAVSLSLSRTKPEPQPSPDGRIRPTLASSPPPDPVAGVPAPPLPLIQSEPPDLRSTVQIRSDPSQPHPIPVNQGSFALKPLCFPKINPRSGIVQKYLQKSPFIYVLDPDLLGNTTRHP